MALRLRRALSLSYPLLHRTIHQPKPIYTHLLSTPISTTGPAAAVVPSSNQLTRPFTSTSTLFLKTFDPETDEIGPDTILFEGCDYNHWLITVDFPKDSDITREQMIETYVDTAAQIFGSVEEAKKKIYAISTTTYQGFNVECSEETSEKFKSLPGVVFVLPDSYIDPTNKEYGGDKYVNGEIFPRPPPVHYGRRDNRDRRRRDNYGPQQQQNYGPGQQQNYGPGQQQNYGPGQQQNYGPSQPHNDGSPPRQDFRAPPAQNDFDSSPSRQNFGPSPPRQDFGPSPPRQDFGPSPPRQDFPPPPPRHDFGPSPPRQEFPPPPPRRDFASPPPQRDFASPPPRQDFASPPPRQDFASPPPRHDYGSSSQQNYGTPPQQSNVPPPQQNYGSPPLQNYGIPPQQNYRIPPQQNYGNHPNSPPQQNYVPQGSGDRRSFTSPSNAYPGNLERENHYPEGQRNLRQGSSQIPMPPVQIGFSPDSSYRSSRGAVSEQAPWARKDFSSNGIDN